MSVKSLTAIAALIGACAATPALAGDIEIVLEGVQVDAGDLYVGLQTEDQFMKDAGIVGKVVSNPAEGTVTVRFADVPEGVYSFSAWHDIDGDGTFSMGERGPTDGWALIGGAELRGEPEFADHSFTVGTEPVRIRETMIYAREER